MVKSALRRLIFTFGRQLRKPILSLYTDSHDVIDMANFVSSLELAKYYDDHMSSTKNFGTSLELLSRAVSLRTVKGLCLEFGVATGTTINYIASLTDETIFGFDVFEGLPEDWRTGFSRGKFKQPAPKVVKTSS